MASCINDFKFSIAMIFSCRYLVADLLREGYFLVVPLLVFVVSLIQKMELQFVLEHREYSESCNLDKMVFTLCYRVELQNGFNLNSGLNLEIEHRRIEHVSM